MCMCVLKCRLTCVSLTHKLVLVKSRGVRMCAELQISNWEDKQVVVFSVSASEKV